jgi:hypothetical protein
VRKGAEFSVEALSVPAERLKCAESHVGGDRFL